MALTFVQASEIFFMKRIELGMNLTFNETADWKIATLKNKGG